MRISTFLVPEKRKSPHLSHIFILIALGDITLGLMDRIYQPIIDRLPCVHVSLSGSSWKHSLLSRSFPSSDSYGSLTCVATITLSISGRRWMLHKVLALWCWECMNSSCCCLVTSHQELQPRAVIAFKLKRCVSKYFTYAGGF